MNVYLRNIHNVVKTYGRQAGRKFTWGRPREQVDKVTISEEGRDLVKQLARRLKKQEQHEGPENQKKLIFKVFDAEKGEERLEEISSEEQARLLERVVAKIMQAKGDE
ncbi:MAG: hypothetical protein GXO20_01200 [Thermodesulfobacteria bacterium]|nr:hypothetical protein [Thermodesulfobacteriota bacterium]